MMILLSKREYDELVKKATAVELLAEEKAAAMKQQLKDDIIKACRFSPHSTYSVESLAAKISEILQHY